MSLPLWGRCRREATDEVASRIFTHSGVSHILLCLLFFILLLPSSAAADIIINEVMALNGEYTSGHSYDWIELVNTGSKAVDISGWHLSDSKKEP